MVAVANCYLNKIILLIPLSFIRRLALLMVSSFVMSLVQLCDVTYSQQYQLYPWTLSANFSLLFRTTDYSLVSLILNLSLVPFHVLYFFIHLVASVVGLV